MKIISWWFTVLIVNCLFYDLIKNTNGDTLSSSKTWLSIGLTVIDVLLIILMFRGI